MRAKDLFTAAEFNQVKAFLAFWGWRVTKVTGPGGEILFDSGISFSSLPKTKKIKKSLDKV